VLGASGHIAGVINPAAKKRRSHWVLDSYPEQPERWLEQAREVPGSWWTLWSQWLSQHGGGSRKAPARTGNTRYQPIEPAPGRYVKHRLH
jgi:polyhydroxyalkanoate synthase subunit PhaC